MVLEVLARRRHLSCSSRVVMSQVQSQQAVKRMSTLLQSFSCALTLLTALVLTTTGTCQPCMLELSSRPSAAQAGPHVESSLSPVPPTSRASSPRTLSSQLKACSAPLSLLQSLKHPKDPQPIPQTLPRPTCRVGYHPT